MDVEIDIPGKFSVYNSLAAIAVCLHFKVSEADIKIALKQATVKEEWNWSRFPTSLP